MSDNDKNVLERGLENIQPQLSSFIRAQTTSSLFLLMSTIVALWWAILNLKPHSSTLLMMA